MNTLVKMQFGSHVYGTDLPTSDLDFKAVYLPTKQDILLGRVKTTIHDNTKPGSSARNSPGDIDIETFSLCRYLKLLLEGQTVSLDMLFTPESFYVQEPAPAWYYIQHHKEHFIHKGISAFVGYTKTQANKYGIKGSRMRAVKEALKMFEGTHDMAKLGDINLQAWVQGEEHMAIVQCKAPNGGLEPHLEVCNRKFPFHAKVKYVRERLTAIYEEYGHRARLAEQNEGIDWKALMHAVRVGREACELLTTGNITFPRPERETLLRIRKGEMPYKEVAEIIEAGLVGIEIAQAMSPLQAEGDKAFAEKLVLEEYERVVRGVL